MSNYASPPQLEENVPYTNLEEVHVFARRWRHRHRGQWFTAGKLSGFCLLMKRAVHEAIGGLNEQFGLGFCDDDDLAERARRAGFDLAVAHDLFVHHDSSRTFTGAGIDAEKLLSENGRKFAAKWGTPAGNGRAVALEPWIGQERSTDRTREIAREFGARVFDFVWVDDFAAARNAAARAAPRPAFGPTPQAGFAPLPAGEGSKAAKPGFFRKQHGPSPSLDGRYSHSLRALAALERPVIARGF